MRWGTVGRARYAGRDELGCNVGGVDEVRFGEMMLCHGCITKPSKS